jgi:MFS family permease
MLSGRFIGGMGDAWVMTNSYIFLMDDFNFGISLGYMEAAIGVGFMIGPVLGSSLYSLLGFGLT